MTEMKIIDWYPELTRQNTVVCGDCGAFVLFALWEQHIENQHPVVDTMGPDYVEPLDAPLITPFAPGEEIIDPEGPVPPEPEAPTADPLAVTLATEENAKQRRRAKPE
jgi:hypothetical protein